MDFASVLTGVVTGVAVAWVTFRLSAGLERERWQRDDRIRREDFERADAARWADERRVLFGRLLRYTDQLRMAARAIYDERKDPPPLMEPWDEGYQVAMEISIIVPDLGHRAELLHLAAAEHVGEASEWADRNPPGAEPPSLDQREAELDKAYLSFLAAAQSDLRPHREAAD